MKFTLKDYQEEAVGDTLERLSKAANRWRVDGDIHAFSLTATTGAGKTVMAAAVFEALFYGDDSFDYKADPSAVVIWFSDDPSLNEQSRFRLMEASDKLDLSDLVVVENKFNREKFEAGKIYFLNTQKLSKSSLLTRGHIDPEDIDSAQQTMFKDSRPDMRAYTIWDTIQNTIEDSNLTLYLLLDEAHRGMGKITDAMKQQKSTIVKRLINGSGSVPPIPIVWGISATVQRFNDAVSTAEGRTTLPNVVVDSSKVQASGLLKDTIVLDVPDQVGQFDTVLLRRGAEKLKDITMAWREYAKKQKHQELVVPLMVLQVPNKPDPDEVGRALDTILSKCPDLDSSSIAHVFGDHTTQTFGRHSVEYIAPQRVQETTKIRVLIAKDAISTGWDCPRAEVMVSFRAAQDRTHITQLLGRMVRTPLARRIPGNDRLNAVDCLLPAFDKKSVEAVAEALMKGGVDEGESWLSGRKVLIKPVELKPNPEIDEKVWQCFESLPSQSLPKTHVKPIKRLTALAHELAIDGLLKNAGKIAHTEMHKVLDASRARCADEIKDALTTVLVVKGKSVATDLRTQSKSFNDFVEDADYTVINDYYRRAARVISPDLARTYTEYLAAKVKGEDPEEALFEGHTIIASLGLVPEIQEYLESEADRLAKKWFNDYRVKIKNLTEDRQEAYRVLKSWSREPVDIDLVRPNSWMVATIALENEVETHLPRFKHHLMTDDENLFPCEMNQWETEVLETEIGREGNLGWYRNPVSASQDSLGISYENDKDYSIIRADFLFFSEKRDGSIVADIVDPHSYHLSDALPKLRGLAAYAETHGSAYRRIEGITKIGDKLKVLDLTDPNVRTAINQSESAKALYEGSIAQDY